MVWVPAGSDEPCHFVQTGPRLLGDPRRPGVLGMGARVELRAWQTSSPQGDGRGDGRDHRRNTWASRLCRQGRRDRIAARAKGPSAA
jgi:hypothetical protein